MLSESVHPSLPPRPAPARDRAQAGTGPRHPSAPPPPRSSAVLRPDPLFPLCSRSCSRSCSAPQSSPFAFSHLPCPLQFAQLTRADPAISSQFRACGPPPPLPPALCVSVRTPPASVPFAYAPACPPRTRNAPRKEPVARVSGGGRRAWPRVDASWPAGPQRARSPPLARLPPIKMHPSLDCLQSPQICGALMLVPRSNYYQPAAGEGSLGLWGT